MSEETAVEMAVEVSPKVGEIIETIGGLKVLELAELVKALEDKFGVSAAAPVMMGAMPAGDDAGEAAVEQTEFDVILNGPGDKKIQVIKVVREITSLGLKEAKAVVDDAPKAVNAAPVSKAEAEEILAKLLAAGATAEIK